MKSLLISILIFISTVTYADPHYVQVLDPFFYQDVEFSNMLDKIDGPVGVEVEKYRGSNDPDVGYDIYIYMYAIKAEGSQFYSLDIGCPGIARPDYKHSSLSRIEIPENSEIAFVRHPSFRPRTEKFGIEINENNQIIWQLDPALKQMGVWLYSRAIPKARRYQLTGESVNGIPFSLAGDLEGPSCDAFVE